MTLAFISFLIIVAYGIWQGTWLQFFIGALSFAVGYMAFAWFL